MAEKIANRLLNGSGPKYDRKKATGLITPNRLQTIRDRELPLELFSGLTSAQAYQWG